MYALPSKYPSNMTRLAIRTPFTVTVVVTVTGMTFMPVQQSRMS